VTGQRPEEIIGLIAHGMANHANATAVALDEMRVRELIRLHKARIAMADLLEQSVDPDGVRGLNIFTLVHAYEKAQYEARVSMQEIDRLSQFLPSEDGVGE